MTIELAEHRGIDCHKTAAKVGKHGLIAATVDNHRCGVVIQMVKVADVLAHVYLKRFSCVVGLFLSCLEYLGCVGVTLLADVMSGTRRWGAWGSAMFQWMGSNEVVKKSSEEK